MKIIALLMLSIPILHSNIITKTFTGSEYLKIITEGSYEVIKAKGSRIIVETHYENNGPTRLQKYIASRYSIESFVENGITTIKILKPKTKIILDSKEIIENINSKIYVPENTIIVN